MRRAAVADGIRILIVDDHVLVREALCERLRREPGFEVIGSAGTADEAVELTIRQKPDLVLMDIDMPGLICFDAARTINSSVPETKIVFLSAFLHDWYINQALNVKARGYLTKRESPDEVVAGLREVARGGTCFSEEVRQRIIVDEGGLRLAEKVSAGTDDLTDREVEVLRYIARGMSKKEVASTMHLSIKTVDRHCANLMTKLDIHDRVELARYAIRNGLAEA